MGRDRRDAEDLAKKLAVKRIDFEVNRGHNEELAEGVSLDITGTDVSHRRVNGCAIGNKGAEYEKNEFRPLLG